MNPRYNIIKFTESYRNAEQRHTILLPVLMVGVVLGAMFLVALTKPSRTTNASIYEYREPAPVSKPSMFDRSARNLSADTNPSSDSSERVILAPPPEIDLDFASGLGELGDLSSNTETDAAADSNSAFGGGIGQSIIPKARVIEVGETGAMAQPAVAGGGGFASQDMTNTQPHRFTPWMTREEMHGLILRLNEGHEKTFWERGNWITAIEGQWANEVAEYRIVYERGPSDRRFAWKYRISKQKDEFAETMVAMTREGYNLVQSQNYEMPDGSLRYQGVWQKFY